MKHPISQTLLSRIFRIVILVGAASLPTALQAQAVSLPLTTGAAGRIDVGAFAGGTMVNVTLSGNGDLIDSRYTAKPDGSLNSPASGSYSFANNGAAYPTTSGGDGINHYSGGGANYDATGSGFGFAGKMTTDTTDPATIRSGAVVGTFSSNPAREDWFLVGFGGNFTVPAGGAHLYLAVNDTVSSDNHGTFSGTVNGATPPPSASTWDAARDLIANERPNDGGKEAMDPNPTVPEWSYGYRGPLESTALTLYTPQQHSNTTSGFYAGLEGFVSNDNSDGVAVDPDGPITLSGFDTLAANEIFFSIGSTDTNSVIRWTCPTAGSYTYHARWHDVDPRGGDGAAGYVVINGVKVFGQAWPNGSGQGAETIATVDLRTGDLLDFVLNPNGGKDYDTAGISITIDPVTPPPVAPPHGGLSATTFTVNESSAPSANLNDTVLRFRAVQTGKPANLTVSVQANTGSGWVNLADGLSGQMAYAPQVTGYLLHSTTYPTTASVRFRAVAHAPGYTPDSISNEVGPFDLTASRPHLGATLLFITTNGEINAIRFGVNEPTLTAGTFLRIQSTQTPVLEDSWSDVTIGGTSLMTQDSDDNHQFYSGTDDYPESEGVYFRAIASNSNGSGYVNSLSIPYGPFKFVNDPAANLTISINGTAAAPNDIDSGYFLPLTGFNLQVNASSGRMIKRLTLLFDGVILKHFDDGATSGALDYSTKIPGDHLVEAYATDDLGVTGAAAPIHVRVLPMIPGKTFQMTNSGDWNTPSNWIDIEGNPGVPGPADFAIVSTYSPTISSNVTVNAMSLNGGTLNGAGTLTVTGFCTIADGTIKSNLTIPSGATCELLNDTDLALSGRLTYAGTLRMHGKGGIGGVPKTSAKALMIGGQPNGLFDVIVGVIKGAGQFVADLVSGGRRGSKTTPAPHKTVAPEKRPIVAASVQIPAGSVTSVPPPAAAVISNDGAGLITNDGAGLVAAGGGNLIAAGGGNLVAAGGGNLVAAGGGNLVAAGGGNLVAAGGGNLVAAGGGNLVAAGGGNFKVVSNTAALHAPGTPAADEPDPAAFVQSGGEVSLSDFTIEGPVVLNGGVLSGSGIILGDLTNNSGYISPGHSPGAIAVTGSFTQGPDGTLIVEDGGATPDLFDQLMVSGTANLGGKLDVKLINSYTPDVADTFNPLGFNSVTGSFASVSSNAQVTTNDSGLLLTANPALPNAQSGQPLNISTRLEVLTNDNILIGGFIVFDPTGANANKKVLIRGLGPSLPVNGTLSDPYLELHNPDGSVVANDNWQDGSNTADIPSGFAPSNPKESLLVATLAPGAYTAQVKGAHGETGIGLVEVYDLDSPSTAKLANISTRGFVDTGDNVMIGGFIIGGQDAASPFNGEPAKILVRAIGPSLTNSGVAGAVPATVLEIHDSNGGVISNDGWRSDQEAEIIATTIPPTSDKESAIVATLPPGAYTAIVRGKDGTTGVAVVEAYNLP